ncbi:MAG: NUDIX domain-containing protein, partial [Bacteroidota bacterium]
MAYDYLRSLRELVGSRKLIHPAARIIIENPRGEILLLRRVDNDQWGLIAGGLEEGESITQCIVREAKEETGLDLHQVEAIGISTRPEQETVSYPNGDVVQYFTVVFHCRVWSGDLLDRSEESMVLRFFAFAELQTLPPNVAPCIHWWGH